MVRRSLTRAGVGALLLSSVAALTPARETRPTSSSIEVTIHEGTNMAAALSPDGATLAIDALGRIWTLPAAGGEALALTDPEGDARQPVWSPDGRRIAFQAYWGGDYDIWAVNADGSGLRQLTSGPFDDREPHWSPDGFRVVFSSDRGGSYDIWEVGVASGEARRVTDAPGNEYGPAYSPDGTEVAYVADGGALGVWVTPRTGEPRLVVDFQSGRGEQLFAPSWSPDGRRVAYNVEKYGSSELFVAPAEAGTGAPTRVSDEDEDVFPFRAQWTEGGRLLYTADGQIRSRPAGGGPAEPVRFTATVRLDRPSYRKVLRGFDRDGPHPVRGIVSPSVSPDGARVAFTALGDLWVMPIGGTPERLTDDPFVETDAMWSPDGTRLAYGSDRSGAMEIWVHDLATGERRRLSEGGGSLPVWSPDGTEIAYATGGFGSESGIHVMSSATGVSRTVRKGLNSPGRVSWSPDGTQLGVSAHWRYSTRFREGVNRALLIGLARVAADDDGPPPEVSGPSAAAFAGDVGVLPEPVLQTNERWLDFLPHGSVGSRGTDGPVWSPDGHSMAYVSGGVLWTIAVSPRGDPLGPPRRMTNEVADDPTWAGDSRSIVYITSDRLRRVWVADGRTEDIPVPLTWERELPTARVVVHAGALFDGNSDALRHDVDIVIDGNRIVRVEPHDAALHTGRVVDASDGVVSPGLIEMHTHGGLSGGEQLGRLWLSYGITSIRMPAADPYDMTEARESIASGRRPGPRTFGTGGTIDGSRIYYAGSPSLASAAQVELEMGRAEALRYDLVKTYVRLPDAVQKRVIADAHAAGIPVTSHELYPAVANGVDGVEHVRGTSRRGYSTKVSALSRSYQDVLELLVRSGMSITPTVGIYGSYGVLAHDDPDFFDDDRVRAFFPWAPGAVRQRGEVEVARRMVSDMASLARRVVEGGGVVVVGTDSPIIPQGLSFHAEMEALVRFGGMRPVDVMRAATSVAARAMGYGSELGSVRAGMLADLVVFEGNPLEEISNTRTVRVVLKNGEVYSMDRLLKRPEA
jgi:Tol biopolymer transport system component/imidazolonepropionase-like amidohydrolase